MKTKTEAGRLRSNKFFYSVKRPANIPSPTVNILQVMHLIKASKPEEITVQEYLDLFTGWGIGNGYAVSYNEQKKVFTFIHQQIISPLN